MSVLKLDKVTKTYEDAEGLNTVIDSLDFELNAGEFVAIVGPSGSGKSTFLSMAGLLLSPDSGNVYVNRIDMSLERESKRTKTRKDSIGFIFQSHHLFPYLKGYDQVDSVINKGVFTDGNEKNRSISDLFRSLGIEDCLNKYPKQMSGGQRQRVAIARAFMNKPALILADEPTASLDSKRGREIVAMIRQEVKRQNVGAVMVTHDERVLDLVDKVYRIESGKLVEVTL